MNRKHLKFLLKLFISAGFVFWIIFKVNWADVFSLIKAVELKYVIIYFIILIAGIAISAYKWQLLAKFKDINLPFGDFFKFYLAGTFVNNFMPSFIGGDTFRAYQSGKVGRKYSQAASSVVIDRLTGLFGAMILTIFFSLLNIRMIESRDILVSLDMLVLIMIVIVFVVFMSRNLKIWKKIFHPGSIIGKYAPKKILDFLGELAHYHSDSRILLKSILLSFVFGMVGLAMTNYVLFWALGAKVAMLDYLSVIFLISIVSSIPVSVNNIGIKEWAYITFFGFFGIGSATVIAVAILSRFLQMILSFAALPVYLKSKH